MCRFWERLGSDRQIKLVGKEELRAPCSCYYKLVSLGIKTNCHRTREEALDMGSMQRKREREEPQFLWRKSVAKKWSQNIIIYLIRLVIGGEGELVSISFER